ncbi:MAG: TolC family protein [Negativicutes bacterium]|jgi:outer membrane protein TolC
MKRLITTTIAALVLCGSLAFADNEVSSITLTLEQALNMSFSQSPAVITAQGAFDAAKTNIWVKSTADNPTLGLQLSATPFKANAQTPTNNPLYSNSITAAYPLFTGFENQANIDAATAGYVAAGFGLNDAIRQARVATSVAYLDCLNAKGDVEANRENVKNLQAHEEFVHNQYDVGRVSRLTLLQSISQLSQAKLDLIKAENTLSKKTTELKIQIGLSDAVQVKLNDVTKALDTPSRDRALADYQNTRPDIRQGTVNLQADSYAIQAANSGWWPSLSLNATAGTSDTNISYVDPNKYAWSIGGTLNYAFSDGGATRAAVQAAQIARDNDKKQLEVIKAQAYAEIKQSYDNLSDASQALVVARDGLAYAQEAYDIAQESYVLGKSDNLTFFDAQKKLFDAKVYYNKALYGTVSASYGVLGAIGSEK